MVTPKLFNKADFEKLNGYYYAHRGLFDNGGNAPENSLNAFKRAVEYGYGIELDVQLSRDSQLVIFHDWDLKRVCGAEKKLEHLTLNRLKQYTLFQSDQKIPTLQEALKAIDGKVPVIIELKTRNLTDELCVTVSKLLDQYNGTYCIESFNPCCLKWYRNNKPHVIRGQLSGREVFKKDEGYRFLNCILKNMLFNFMTKPDFIAYDKKGKKALSFRICSKFYGAKTFGWTIRNNDELDDNKIDFDYIIFDSFKPNMIK